MFSDLRATKAPITRDPACFFASARYTQGLMTLPDQSQISPADSPLRADHRVCVLWHPRGRTPAEALLKALANKGMRVTLAHDAHAVFAACSVCKDAAARTVLLLDARGELEGVDRVLGALERFGPGVICWEHRVGANPPMVPVVQRPMPVVTPSEPLPSVRTGQPMPLRLVGKPDAESRREPTPSPEIPSMPLKRGPINARDVLDADELDALLAGELGKMDDRPGRR